MQLALCVVVNTVLQCSTSVMKFELCKLNYNVLQCCKVLCNLQCHKCYSATLVTRNLPYDLRYTLLRYCNAATEWLSKKKIEVKPIPSSQAEGYSIPTFKWYDGGMLAILGDI